MLLITNICALQDWPLHPITHRAFESWSKRVRDAVPLETASPYPRIRAPDATTAAQVLLFLVRWIFEDPATRAHGPTFEAALTARFSPVHVICHLTTLGKLITTENLDFQM